MNRPFTRAESRRIRQVEHREKRQADYANRLGEWGILLAWFDEAKAAAKAQQRNGSNAAVVELARTLESYCKRYGR